MFNKIATHVFNELQRRCTQACLSEGLRQYLHLPHFAALQLAQ